MGAAVKVLYAFNFFLLYINTKKLKIERQLNEIHLSSENWYSNQLLYDDLAIENNINFS